MKYMLAMLLLFSIGASAQIQLDSIIVKQRFKLNGYRVTGISNDTASSSQDSSKLITEKAAKNLASTKVQYIDTAPALAAYQAALNARLRYTDTAALLVAYRTALNARLKFTDTSAMLSAYITALVARVRYSDTASMLTAYRSALLARMNYTDSSGMLTAYQAAINARLRISDTAAILAAYQSALNARQVTLVSGTNIKTINGSSVLGSGNITVSGGGVTGSGTVSNSLVPLATWSISNSVLSSTIQNNLNWDTINNALNIGTSIQQNLYKLNVNGAANITGQLALSNTSNYAALLQNSNNTNSLLMIPSTGSTNLGNHYIYGGFRGVTTASQIAIAMLASGAGTTGTLEFWNGAASETGMTSPAYKQMSINAGLNSSPSSGNGNVTTWNGFQNRNGIIGCYNSGNNIGSSTIEFGHFSQTTVAISSQSTGYNGGGDLRFIVRPADGSRYTIANTVAMFFNSTGNLAINSTVDDATNKLQVNGSAKVTQYRLSALNTAPISSSDTGTTGEIRITSTFIYVCTANNTWVRSSLSTF